MKRARPIDASNPARLRYGLWHRHGQLEGGCSNAITDCTRYPLQLLILALKLSLQGLLRD